MAVHRWLPVRVIDFRLGGAPVIAECRGIGAEADYVQAWAIAGELRWFNPDRIYIVAEITLEGIAA